MLCVTFRNFLFAADFVTGCTFHAVLNTGPHTLKLYCPPIPNLSCILDSEANQQWTKYGNAILHMDIFSGTEHTSRKSPNYDMEIESNQELVGNDLKVCSVHKLFLFLRLSHYQLTFYKYRKRDVRKIC